MNKELSIKFNILGDLREALFLTIETGEDPNMLLHAISQFQEPELAGLKSSIYLEYRYRKEMTRNRTE